LNHWCHRNIILLFLLFLSFSLYPLASAHAQSQSDETYTSAARIPKQGETVGEKSLGLIAWPLDLVRKGLDESLYTVEHYRLDDKAKWAYQEMTDHGFYPKLEGLSTFGDSGPRADLDFLRAAGQAGRFPYFRAKSGVGWIPQALFRVYSELGVEKSGETGPYGSFNFHYEQRPREDFFGIGPDTSRGDSMNYKSEATTLETRLGYSVTPKIDLIEKFAYKNVNIRNGDDGGKGLLDRSIRGANGAEFLILGSEITHDTRDFPSDPHKGGVERFGFSYYDGVNHSNFRYFKYRAEIARYQEIFSDRQVLGVRFLGEHNDEFKGRGIPFFEMARLGGYGVYPSLGDTQRGFQRNRFYGESLLLMNLEYRYLVWQHRDFSLDAVIFWDEGQVFNEISQFEFRDFRTSVGGGFRFKILRNVLLSAEIARSSEGTQLYVATHTPF